MVKEMVGAAAAGRPWLPGATVAYPRPLVTVPSVAFRTPDIGEFCYTVRSCPGLRMDLLPQSCTGRSRFLPRAITRCHPVAAVYLRCGCIA